jgi:hypothetical protein
MTSNPQVWKEAESRALVMAQGQEGQLGVTTLAPTQGSMTILDFQQATCGDGGDGLIL